MKEQSVLAAPAPGMATGATLPTPANTTTNGTPPTTALVSDYLEEAVKGSEGEEAISSVITENMFDPDFTTRWKPYRVELIKNKRLDDEYDEKRQDLLIRGRKGRELEEEYGFTVQNAEGTARVVTGGLGTREADYNPLGYSRLGVYLCRHPDICIEHSLLQHPQPTAIRLIVCKYLKGRTTTAIPRPASSAGFIEPTQGYDGHTSALRPGNGDPLQTQYDRAQIYLYEINKLLQPSSRPRQVLPLAVVTLTEGGSYVPEVDTKLEVATPPETISATSPPLTVNVGANPRLAQIIDAINARSGGTGSSNSEKGLLGSPTSACSPDPTVANANRGLPIIVGPGNTNSDNTPDLPSPKLTNLQHINLPQKYANTAPGIPLLEQALGGTNGLVNGHLTGLGQHPHGGLLMEGVPPGRLLLDSSSVRVNGDGQAHLAKAAMAAVDSDGNPKLALVINKINARLQTEPKPATPGTGSNNNVSSSSSAGRLTGQAHTPQGDGLLPLPTSNTGLSLNNGNLAVNGAGSGSSSLGSRPGSADSLLSGTTGPQCGTKLPTTHLLTSTGAVGNHACLTESLNGEAPPTSSFGMGQKVGMAAQLAAGLPFTMGLTHGVQTGHNTGLLARKEVGRNTCMDAFSQMYAAGGMAGLYQSLHGQPLYTDRLPGHPQTAPHPAVSATALTTARAPGLHALTPAPYQVLGLNMGFGPAALTTTPTTPLHATPTHPHLTSLTHQSSLALRPFTSALKRPFPETAAAIEWEKRPKFF